MALQFSVSVGNARLNAIETTVGTSPILEIRTGSPPANCAASDSGTLLASVALPSDWMGDAADRAKAKSGTWQDASADGTGTAGHFRIKNNAGSTVHIQGTCGALSSGADMELTNTSLATGQTFTVDSFVITDGNA